ncbi:MAG: hypothetical protein FWF12_09785 [Betaproteobacteria bacterium]|nr:hypothetical protein [Betaproteobacteria bacterium]
MNNQEKQFVEIQLALKERRLALNEREHDLTVKKWRRWVGIPIVIIAVFLLCASAIFIGGSGIGFNLWNGAPSFIHRYVMDRNDDDASKSVPTHITMVNANHQGKYSPGGAMTLSNNNVSIISPNDSTTIALHKGTPEKKDQPPYSLLPVVALILNGLLAFAGLGVAAYTVRLIVKRDDD